MSVKAMAAVLDAALDPPLKLTLLVLANYANHDGENAYPSVDVIAEKTGYSRATVFRHLKQLVEGGWIMRTRGPGQHRPVTYRITLQGSYRETSQNETPGLPGVSLTHPGVSLTHPRGLTGETQSVSNRQMNRGRLSTIGPSAVDDDPMPDTPTPMPEALRSRIHRRKDTA